MTRKAFLGLAALAAAKPLAAQDDTRTRRWREDLQFLVAEILRLHPNPFSRSSRQDFERVVADLEQRIPELASHEVVIAFSRLLAMFREGHTSVVRFPTGPGLRLYPLRLEWFPEGVYAVRAPDSAVEVLGGRLRAIAGIPIEEAWDKARPLISADNEWAVRAQMPSVLVSPEVLQALRMIPEVGPAAYTFEASDGREVTATVPLSANAAYDWPRFARPARLPFQQDAGLNYWFDYLEAHRTLYIKYNSCFEDPTLPMAEFARQVGSFVRQQRVERLVLDVRNNSGGRNGVITPLLAVLVDAIESGALPPSVRGFCIIGRQTASSAMWNAIDLKRGGVTLVGEPTGGKPNAPGNVEGIRLPNSQIAVNVSTRMYDNQYPEFGDAESLAPDLRVDFSIEDYRMQRDPFLEKSLE